MSALTPSQKKVIGLARDGQRQLICWYGGVRAGKTTGAVKAFIEHQKTRHNATYLIGAYTIAQIWEIIAPIFEEECAEQGLDYAESRSSSRPTIWVGSNAFLLFGAGLYGRHKRIQGITASGLFLDEFPNLDRRFIFQAEARLSEDNALRIYTANKGAENHWTKRYYHDRILRGDISGVVVDSDTTENPHIAQAYIDERRSEYNGATLKQFLDNEFASDNPPIYTVSIVDEAERDTDIIIIVKIDATCYIYHVSLQMDGRAILSGEREVRTPTISELGHATTYLVSSDMRYIGQSLRSKGSNVRMFSPSLYHPSDSDRVTRLLQDWVSICTDSPKLYDAVYDYHANGMNKSILVSMIEFLSEYLLRANRSEYAYLYPR